MARVTVEDCLNHVDNRFELVLEGSKRARQLAFGAIPAVEWDNDKCTVVALREIAEGHVGLAEIEEQTQERAQQEEQQYRHQQQPHHHDHEAHDPIE